MPAMPGVTDRDWRLAGYLACEACQRPYCVVQTSVVSGARRSPFQYHTTNESACGRKQRPGFVPADAVNRMKSSLPLGCPAR